MFSILFLGLAAAASTDPILVVDDRPAISINLGRYDLGRRGDLRRLEATIHYVPGRSAPAATGSPSTKSAWPA
jgi:hypothetical protein